MNPKATDHWPFSDSTLTAIGKNALATAQKRQRQSERQRRPLAWRHCEVYVLALLVMLALIATGILIETLIELDRVKASVALTAESTHQPFVSADAIEMAASGATPQLK